MKPVSPVVQATSTGTEGVNMAENPAAHLDKQEEIEAGERKVEKDEEGKQEEDKERKKEEEEKGKEGSHMSNGGSDSVNQEEVDLEDSGCCSSCAEQDFSSCWLTDSVHSRNSSLSSTASPRKIAVGAMR